LLAPAMNILIHSHILRKLYGQHCISPLLLNDYHTSNFSSFIYLRVDPHYHKTK